MEPTRVPLRITKANAKILCMVLAPLAAVKRTVKLKPMFACMKKAKVISLHFVTP